MVLAFAGLLVLALAARLVTWPQVFTPAGVRLIDVDPHYHVLRAERILHGDTARTWFDPHLDYPAGAAVLWPPGFDALVAATAWLAHGADASRRELERVAVFVPVGLGAVTVALMALLAAATAGRATALYAGLLTAVLPMWVRWSVLGGVDQHVAEQLGLCLALLGLAWGATRPRLAAPLVGLALVIGPWVWQGAVLTAAFVVGAAAMVLVLRPEGMDRARHVVRSVASACAGAAAALAASMLLWGPPAGLPTTGLNGLSWVHPAVLAAGALGLAALCAVDRLRPASSPGARALASGAIGVLAGAAGFAAAPGAVLHGLASLRASDPWLRTITEFQPVFGSIGSFREDAEWLLWAVGPIVLAPALGVIAFRRAWSAAPERRTALAVLALGTLVFGLLFLLRSRFLAYAAPFLVGWAAVIVADGLASARESTGRRRVVALACAAIFLLPVVRLGPATRLATAVDEELIALLGRIRAREAPAPRAVLAPWPLGHAIAYYAGAPAIATPFGADVGPGGLQRLGAFLHAPTSEAAEQVLRAAGVGSVLLQADLGGISDAFAFAPPGSTPFVEEERDYWGDGRKVRTLPAFEASVLGALYVDDGGRGSSGRQGIPFLRLVDETDSTVPVKLFERVEGARITVRGVPPLEPAGVLVDVRTPGGREFTWACSALADAHGNVTLRVPYATGANGRSTASDYLAVARDRAVPFEVTDEAVRGGGAIDVVLAETAPTAARTR